MHRSFLEAFCEAIANFEARTPPWLARVASVSFMLAAAGVVIGNQPG